MPAVELKSVSKSFSGKPAVTDLDMLVPRGCVFGFIGPNGSGKTTTLRMILRIIAQDQGSVSVLGETGGRSDNDAVGYLPEERGLYKKMRVKDVLRFHLALKNRAAALADAKRSLERLGLGDRLGAKVESLSKGMAQKLQFLVAVAHEPALAILDEPLSGLDPLGAELLEGEIRDLSRRGCTVLLSTHDMASAERMCDRVFMIHKGRAVMSGTLLEIRERHGSGGFIVETPLPDEALKKIEGVAHVAVAEGRRFIEARPGVPGHELLQRLCAAGPVSHFAAATPSLRDIFFELAGFDPQEPR